MELRRHYERMYRESVGKISGNNYALDNLIDSHNDKRSGITLLLRPSPEVKRRISPFMREMKEIDPHQYYYPESDMHVTVLSIISCYDAFDISQINVPEYTELIGEALSGMKSFTIDIKGITASPSCIMVAGFPRDEVLNGIRSGIRASFRKSKLLSSIDKRYEIKTAHSTVIRFRRELSDVSRYLEKLESYRDFDFGSFEVTFLELVHNDWYQRRENTGRLKCFDLPDQNR